MKINLKRLQANVDRKKKARQTSPTGRSKTGATDIIRRHLSELQRMFDEGASWSEIAAGLAEEGVVQGQGQPITGRRLTALMHNIKSGGKKLKVADVKPPASKPQSSKKSAQKTGTVKLSAEMTTRIAQQPPSAAPLSEKELRLAEIAKHAHLLKKR